MRTHGFSWCFITYCKDELQRVSIPTETEKKAKLTGTNVCCTLSILRSAKSISMNKYYRKIKRKEDKERKVSKEKNKHTQRG